LAKAISHPNGKRSRFLSKSEREVIVIKETIALKYVI